MKTKKCSYCNVIHSLSDFPTTNGKKFAVCKLCRKEKRKLKQKGLKRCKVCLEVKENKNFWGEVCESCRQKEPFLTARKEAVNRCKLKNRERNNERNRKHRDDNVEAYLLKTAKGRAKRGNLPFDITVKDVVIPKFCPILKIPLFRSKNRKPCDNSPSIDRIIPELGYVKGNIAVISYKANVLKRNGKIKDFEAIVLYLQNHFSENLIDFDYSI